VRKIGIVGIGVCVWIILITAAYSWSADELTQTDPGKVALNPSPSRKDMELGLSKALTSMPGGTFDQYRNLFIGKTVLWQGTVYGIQNREGQCWLLICAMCEGGANMGFDTFVPIPCFQAQAYKKGDIVTMGGRIKAVLDSEKGVFDFYRSGFKVQLE
jgi:hypothetical protein